MVEAGGVYLVERIYFLLPTSYFLLPTSYFLVTCRGSTSTYLQRIYFLLTTYLERICPPRVAKTIPMPSTCVEPGPGSGLGSGSRLGPGSGLAAGLGLG